MLYGGRRRPEDEFLTMLYQLLVVVACCFLGSANISLSPDEGGKILSCDFVSNCWIKCVTKTQRFDILVKEGVFYQSDLEVISMLFNLANRNLNPPV